MNIYSIVPLIATIAYIPLLITTYSNRPWSKQHKLFMLFLLSTTTWSLFDYILRSYFFPEIAHILIKCVVVLFFLTAVQFHVFSSSLFPQGRKRWLIFAYASLALSIIMTILGYLPQKLVTINGLLYAEYGWTIILIAVPMMVLMGRNLYVFIPRLRNRENPVDYNQNVAILLCLGAMAVFIGLAATKFGRIFPIAHVGNIVIALILIYAVVGHQLVDIRLVLRRGTIWVCIVIIGIIIFWSLLFVFHFLFDLKLNFTTILVVTLAAILSSIAIFRLNNIVARFMSKALQGQNFYYREQLVDFANKIHNVFSLKEQGAELLSLIIKSIGCRKAGLLFLNSSGDYDAQFVESSNNEETLSGLKLRGDNPVVEYLKRERQPLTRENISIKPEFLGLWQQEKDILDQNQIELFMPLISRDRLIGILIMDHKVTGHYQLEDYTMLQDVINRVSVSMEKEYLREQLREREQELSVINRSNAIITSSLDIQRIYDNFIQELKRVVDVDWAAIAVIEDLEVYFMALSTEIGSPWKVGERLPLKGSGTEWVAAHGKPIVDNDLSVEIRFSSSQYHLQHGIRTVAYLPLIISNQIIGSLIVASRKSNAYNTKKIDLLQQLSTQIAMPIENSRLYAKTERMARVDGLTGLLNRRSLDETLASEIGRHSRYGGVFTLIMIDLDSLKNVNDNYGHLAGDELLRQIGNIIQNSLRETDRAFRYGGDEFAILLPQTTIEAAFKVAERIRQQTFARIEIGSVPISVSLGLSSWPGDGVAPGDLVSAADAALYHAKRSGRNRTVCSNARAISDQHEQVNIKAGDGTDSVALSTIYALAATVDNRDRYTHNHSKQVHDFAVILGEEMGLNQLEINRLGTCALLHDIGKIGINDELLHKKEALTHEEWETIKSHAKLGAAIVGHASQLLPCVEGILHHHEKWDGSGYPDGLKGDNIPLESRILTIADSFAAMTAARVYSRSLTWEAAVQEIKNGAGTQFDPKLVEIFLKVVPKTIEVAEKPQFVSDLLKN
jgi:diguanylate cyclase (GGDEF)-like protein